MKNDLDPFASLLAAAITYVRLDLRVFPLYPIINGCCGCGNPDCTAVGKHPHVRSWRQSATNDPALADFWWSTAYPGAGIAACTDDLMVIDIDARHGGFETLVALEEQYAEFPRTWTAESGGGGLHYYFKYAEPVKSGTNVLGSGIDVRATGGMIVLPPSPHVSGKAYSWVVSPVAETLAELPQWVSPLIVNNRRHVKPETDVRPVLNTADVRQALDGALKSAKPGNRNHVGFSLACTLRDMRYTREQVVAVITNQFVPYVKGGDHPYSLTEAQKSVSSAFAPPRRSILPVWRAGRPVKQLNGG